MIYLAVGFDISASGVQQASFRSASSINHRVSKEEEDLRLAVSLSLTVSYVLIDSFTSVCLFLFCHCIIFTTTFIAIIFTIVMVIFVITLFRNLVRLLYREGHLVNLIWILLIYLSVAICL